MKTVMDIEPGWIVCVKGQGTALGVHYHAKVDRITKTMIIVGHRRFRRETAGHSIPYSSYGGCRVAAHCLAKT